VFQIISFIQQLKLDKKIKMIKNKLFLFL